MEFSIYPSHRLQWTFMLRITPSTRHDLTTFLYPPTHRLRDAFIQVSLCPLDYSINTSSVDSRRLDDILLPPTHRIQGAINFSEWRTQFEFVFGAFSMFVAEIWRECCPIIRQKNSVDGCSFFLLSMIVMTNNRQVIKIFRLGFLEKKKKTKQYCSLPSTQVRPKASLISEPVTSVLWEIGRYIQKTPFFCFNE